MAPVEFCFASSFREPTDLRVATCFLFKFIYFSGITIPFLIIRDLCFLNKLRPGILTNDCAR